jgi:large subunit ribosomal protein L3
MRAAGRMGGKRITTKNVRVVKVDEERGLLFLHGAVPGPRGGYLTIRRAKKG